ncbi:MAG: rRNA cytosine-C5-methyltransferase, partial [Bacteroidaceae bacterium]|nr:rRNA cytosine-C5-methyltransferase [Bacteroidaceae bacterium]
EGFFLAVLRKRPDVLDETPKRFKKTSRRLEKKKGKDAKQPLSVPREAKAWLNDADAYELIVNGTMVEAFPKAFHDVYALLKPSLKVIHAGITLGEIKGKDLIPHHSLAMSTALASGVFQKAEVTYEQAIAYLRKEGLVLDASVPRGYVLVTYHQVPLGFVKNIGNRANNLYPQEWRIRSGYLPEEIVCVF